MYWQNPINYNDIEYLQATILYILAAPKLPPGYSKLHLSFSDAQLFEKIVKDISDDYPQHRNYGEFLLSRLHSSGYTGINLIQIPRQPSRYLS